MGWLLSLEYQHLGQEACKYSSSYWGSWNGRNIWVAVERLQPRWYTKTKCQYYHQQHQQNISLSSMSVYFLVHSFILNMDLYYYFYTTSPFAYIFYKDLCTSMFIMASFTIIKKWSESGYLPTGEWMVYFIIEEN